MEHLPSKQQQQQQQHDVCDGAVQSMPVWRAFSLLSLQVVSTSMGSLSIAGWRGLNCIALVVSFLDFSSFFVLLTVLR